MESIYWHDYETFGADPQRDRPAQFAGVRTDLQLNPISDPDCFYCRPSDDVLPAPEACLVTGITPQEALREGVCEAEFARRVHEIFSQPKTCVAGYNSVRFDDEVSRNLFYRNFYDPYEREWKNGNSRWDIIDVLRMTYALRPEGIVWPKGENGEVSFRLELLTQANGIAHEAAHDAVSDVYATIAVAKLVKSSQPKLFDYAFTHRTKQQLAGMLDVHSLKPVFHISSKFPVALGCCAMVLPLFQHPKNANAIVCLDLRQNPEDLFSLSTSEIKARLYSAASELGDRERPALKAVHLNKCPMIVNAAVVKNIPEERLSAWKLDLEAMRGHLKWIRARPELIERLVEVYNENPPTPSNDPDLMIYSGGFFSDRDKQEMQRVRATDPSLLAEEEFRFEDVRLDEMLFRYRARNFPDTLAEDERERWEQYRVERLIRGANDTGSRTIESFMYSIGQLANRPDRSVRDQHILQELQYYAESIVPYV